MNKILVLGNSGAGKSSFTRELADILKGKFGEIIEYIKKDDQFFNFNDPKYAAKLEEEFGSAASRFLDLVASPIFSKNERLALQARKVNAKATQDKAINAAEANADLSGYGQYQNSQRANLVDSGYSVEQSAAQKASEKRHNLRILEDKEKVTCDLTTNKPREIDVMNCIKAKYDAGITSFQSEGGGVVERVYCSACLMNFNKVEKVDNDVAKTLMARDYKGFGTGFDVQNGVIEIE